MYKCNSCKSIFSDPEYHSDSIYHSELDSGQRLEWTTVYTCPYCGSEHVEETEICPICKDEPVDHGMEYCWRCHEELGAYLLEIQDSLKLDYDQLKEMIAEHFGW